MFVIKGDKSIHLTRGDVAPIQIGVNNGDAPYIFTKDDVVRFQVFEKGKCNCVVLQKEIAAEEGSQTVTVLLNKEDTTIGGVINKPVDYWYEVELNPDTNPQTIISYDENGPKLFKLYPEGSDVSE